jgi:hypothetical protein
MKGVSTVWFGDLFITEQEIGELGFEPRKVVARTGAHRTATEKLCAMNSTPIEGTRVFILVQGIIYCYSGMTDILVKC